MTVQPENTGPDLGGPDASGSETVVPADRDRNVIERIVDRIDGVQRRRPVLGFVIAVAKKFGDDRCGNFAALVSYYGFFSLFPLLFVLVAIGSLVLRGDPDLQRRLVESAVSRFPVIGDQITEAIGRPSGGVLTIAVGVLVAVWAGLGATQVGQDALNAIFSVPILDRDSFLVRRLRGLITLLVFGTATVAITALGSVAAWADLGGFVGDVATMLGATALNVALVAALFEVLSHERLGWRRTRVGAIFGGVSWTLLQLVGSIYVQRVVANASKTYGFFAVVIGLLSWIFLQAQLFLYAAEAASVADRHLWPRAIVRERPTAADIEVADLIEVREQRVKASERAWRTRS